MKQYQLAEWQQMVNSAKASLNSACPLIEDEVVVAVANRLDKLEAFVQWIARDYVESSHDKVRWQRDDYIKRAKELLNELYDEEPHEKECCEGGPLTAGCFHDNCTGPKR